MNDGPIIIVEDDADDRSILEGIFRDLETPNERIWFENAILALDYLSNSTAQQFLILSDMNLPVMNGIEFKTNIDKNKYLRQKSVPFIFYSTAANPEIILKAYGDLTIQGYFQKNAIISEIKNDIRLILDYWTRCLHPNSKLVSTRQGSENNN